MRKGHVAVIDIGKTNAKLALVDLADLSEIAVVTRPNAVLSGPPYPHFDVDGHWTFLLDALRGFQRSHGIDAITVTTHGACAALLDADGRLAAPVLDYEHAAPDDLGPRYDAIRPEFDETGSPRLGVGLNLGAQLFWQFQTIAGLKDRTKAIVTYPQYWGFRLTGVAATDVTSLGCHTDLWNPHEGKFSSLVERLDISDKIAPARRSGDILGPIRGEIAERTGISADVPVYCGIHDSNASLLPHVLTHDPPFAVVSTGTWVIAMAIGGRDVPLDPKQDVLINVNAFGNPVPSARFMGGREFDVATGDPCPAPTDDDIAAVLDAKIMLLPAVEPGSGPFRGQRARWIGLEPPAGSGRRGAAVGLYLALVTARCLENIGHAGPVVVEGPFAANRVYLRMLAAITDVPIIPSKGITGTSQGAAMLAVGNEGRRRSKFPDKPRADALDRKLKDYAKVWQENVTDRMART